tara:strand:- start:9660 stop:9950 length:291 start_codon:yes stop_codon:yes gene_type:complete
MRFLLTAKAEDDIISIAEAGLRLFGETQALSYHLQLYSMFELIAANPRMARERIELVPPVRIHPFKSHLIVYVITEMDGVLIIRIRHGHEDWMEQL